MIFVNKTTMQYFFCAKSQKYMLYLDENFEKWYNIIKIGFFYERSKLCPYLNNTKEFSFP